MDNALKIINYLGKHSREKYTMHNLSQTLHIPYTSFYRTVEMIKDFLVIENVGKSKVLSLNVKRPIVKAHLTVSSDEEKKEFLKKQPILSKISQELNTEDIVLLFGSYAKGKETDKSDIDLCIINKNGQKSLSFSKYELLFKKKINPMFITSKEFKEMLKDKEENVGKQALKDHIVLNNPEQFWELVLNAF